MKIVNTDTSKKRPSAWWLLLLLAPLLWVGAKWLQLRFSGRVEQILFCDMEKVTEDGKDFVYHGQRFSNGMTQNEAVALSGRYSSRCSPEHKFGPTVILPDLGEGDEVVAEIWRYSEKGTGVLVVQGDWGFWEATNEVLKKQGNWELLKIRTRIPLGSSAVSLSVYPMFKSGEAVWFDDFQVVVRRQSRREANLLKDSFPSLNIRVDQQAYDQLRAKRNEALERGNLISGKADLVPAILEEDTLTIEAKIRLKGDLLDHLQGKKWSFRILCKPGKSWKNMQAFSVHNAASRYYLDEWVYHRLLIDEDLLTTPYDFLKLSLNGEPLGIYAYEEHFTDHLLESQGREPGIIVRIDEAGHWLHASQNLIDRPAWYQSASYLPYERAKIKNNSFRYRQWIRAQELLYGFLKGDLKPAEVFDTTRMAKFVALTDVARAFHALNFTNIRFYYDPLHDRLEPLGYDGYSTDGTKWFNPPALFGSHYNSRSKNTYQPGVEDAYLAYRLFNDTAFTATYIRYLQKFTSEAYVQQFLQKHLPAMEAREEFLRLEYTQYDFKWGDYFRNAAEIRKLLNPLALTSVKAWSNASRKIVLENYFLFPVEVVGFGNGKEPDYRLESPFLLEAYDQAVPIRRYDLQLPRKYKYVFIRTLGLQQLQRERIAPWQAPAEPRPKEKYEFTPEFAKEVGEGVLLVPSGKYVLNRDWYIHKDQVLRMGPGVEIDLQNGAMIISEAVLDWQGSEEEPITIFSSDKTGGGVLVLSTQGPSYLSKVHLKGLTDRREHAPFSRAAFTAYQAELYLSGVLVEDIRAENALHLLQCKYGMENIFIRQVTGDGIDADRSTGSIQNIYIENCGEDGLEISAMYADINHASFKGIHRVALRIGAEAKVKAQNVAIAQSVKGVAVHDGAMLQLKGLQAMEVHQLLLSYRKAKTASKGGDLNVEQLNCESILQLYLLDSESTIFIDGEQKK